MDLMNLLNEKVFLGQEFLTWLWHLCETEPALTLPDGRQVELMLGDRLLLGPAMGQEGTRVTVSGREASLAEARQALKRGKLVEALRLGIMLDGEEYTLSLNAAELAVSGLKTPATAPAEGGPEGMEGLVLERVALIEAAVRGLEGLFELFLRGRLADEAGGELWARMKAWAQAGAAEA